ncbi:MAG: hypothetical protein EAY81_02960 [Bacteroidetes bacterium]|nr:MAG: hypothetical protein EAY81_02960 [Bacteroidota bacterium]
MNNKINIDELLKQELSNMEADVPADVWEHIHETLDNSATLQSNSSEFLANATGAKAFVGVKTLLATISVVAVSALAVYQFAFKQDKMEPVKAEYNTSQGATYAADNKEESEIQALANPTKIPSNSSENKPTQDFSHSKQQKHNRHNQEETINKPAFVGSEMGESGLVKSEVPPPIKASAPVKSNANDAKQTSHEPTQGEPRRDNNDINPKYLQDNLDHENYNHPIIPNVFTPNGDGVNDEFVITIEHESIYDLKITNLKGEVLFESVDKNKHWDGKHQYSGNLCEPGVYVLAFRYQVEGMKEAKVVNSKIIIKH